MRNLIVALISLSLSAAAQTAKADSKQTPEQELHADVLTLVRLEGAKQKMQEGLGPMIDQGKEKMKEVCPNCSQAFIDEWGKRMQARLKVDDFVNVVIGAYEKHLTDADVKELIASVKAQKDSKPSTISPALKEKLTSVFPSIQSEIMGGCTQIGAKLGAEVGQEIEKDHPEYTTNK